MFEAVSTAFVCCVVIIPKELQSIITLVYSWDTINMAAKKDILPVVKTLGSVTIICSDKIGTLMQNVMSLTALVASNV